MAGRPLYRELASIVLARKNCIRSNNAEWRGRHEERIERLVKDCLPSGSGIDNGTKIDLDKSDETRLTFYAGYHHMNENGYYDGWTEHVITVRPSFDGIDIAISGRNRNDIKDYLHECYAMALTKETPVEVAV